MDGNYYLGLDMGTSSCGWSVTDEEYHVLRRHRKALWGVRLFEGAKTAEERRMHRTGRRRLDRRGWRINILQELFAEEVSKIDPGFFLRMKESKYYPEDKRDINGERPELPYALFVDPEFTDKDYHTETTNTNSNTTTEFENDVKMYGTETIIPIAPLPASLRMM